MPHCGIFIALLLIKKAYFREGGTIMKKAETSPHIFIDPVCLMQIKPSGKDITLTHRMRTYYFCAEKCRDVFKANPDKYLISNPSKGKGLWGRYLERLNKVTGGKPPKCCH